MRERYAHALGALVAASLPLLLVAQTLPVATPIVPASWQSYVALIDRPLREALARIAWLVPLGSDGVRESGLALVIVCAACASLFVFLDIGVARLTRAFDLAASLRAPLVSRDLGSARLCSAGSP